MSSLSSGNVGISKVRGKQSPVGQGATVPAPCAEQGRALLRDRTPLCLSRALLGTDPRRPTDLVALTEKRTPGGPVAEREAMTLPGGASLAGDPRQNVSKGPKNGAHERKTQAWPSTQGPKPDTRSTRAKALLSSQLLCSPRTDPVALVHSSWSGGRDSKKGDRRSPSAAQRPGR